LAPVIGLLECVVNVSEGRDPAVVTDLASAGGRSLLDTHTDADHNRTVLTLAGAPGEVEAAARAVAWATTERLNLAGHSGVHPRIGALDVVPFVALVQDPATGHLADGLLGDAVAARDRFARWAAEELGLPCFVYGPERTLPELRRAAWTSLAPDFGPEAPHPTAGAVAVGARPVLVAYNLWLGPGAGLPVARQVAAVIRGPALRTLGLPVADTAQVSCNLVDPWRLGPGAVFDLVAGELERRGAGNVARAELVGLLPRAVLASEPPTRWAELGLSQGETIEARLSRRASTGEGL
jgi:glutamate formiminotransferase